jgi:hypothetical protein
MNWKLEKSIEPDAAIEKIRAGDLEALEQFDTLTQALAARGNYCYTQHCTALHCTALHSVFVVGPLLCYQFGLLAINQGRPRSAEREHPSRRRTQCIASNLPSSCFFCVGCHVADGAFALYNEPSKAFHDGPGHFYPTYKKKPYRKAVVDYTSADWVDTEYLLRAMLRLYVNMQTSSESSFNLPLCLDPFLTLHSFSSPGAGTGFSIRSLSTKAARRSLGCRRGAIGFCIARLADCRVDSCRSR